MIALRKGLDGKIDAVREKKMTIEAVVIVSVLTALLDAAAGELATEGEFPYHVRSKIRVFISLFVCLNVILLRSLSCPSLPAPTSQPDTAPGPSTTQTPSSPQRPVAHVIFHKNVQYLS